MTNVWYKLKLLLYNFLVYASQCISFYTMYMYMDITRDYTIDLPI